MSAMIPAFELAAVKSSEWIREVMSELDVHDEHKALRAFRAGLHALRDRLPAAEVTDLAAQLPTLIRGLYYEGWSAGDHPRIRSQDAFLGEVRKILGDDQSLDAIVVVRAVIRILARHVSDGELDDIARVLPRRLAELWEDGLA
jgi:uncharacterized protein (DUF2267 family)